MADSSVTLHSSSFVLAVPNLKTSAAYFRDALGFSLAWPEDLGWQLASRGSIRIMLGHSPEGVTPAEIGDHNYFGYFTVKNVDALYEEYLSSGAIILQSPEDKPHGMREFTVATPDGHRMMFGQEIA